MHFIKFSIFPTWPGNFLRFIVSPSLLHFCLSAVFHFLMAYFCLLPSLFYWRQVVDVLIVVFSFGPLLGCWCDGSVSKEVDGGWAGSNARCCGAPTPREIFIGKEENIRHAWWRDEQGTRCRCGSSCSNAGSRGHQFWSFWSMLVSCKSTFDEMRLLIYSGLMYAAAVRRCLSEFALASGSRLIWLSRIMLCVYHKPILIPVVLLSLCLCCVV